MGNSPLVNYTKISPNHSGLRTERISRITPHCAVGQVSVETLGEIFSYRTKLASSNYGIGHDGKVGLYVDECNRSWCSSSNHNDQRAITIECASGTTEPYEFNDVVYNKLVDLCVDICRRYGKTELLWLHSKEATENYNPDDNEMLISLHRWYANKSCPGEWLFSRLDKLASDVTERLNNVSKTETVPYGTITTEQAINKMAEDVMLGRYGNGLFRKNKLYEVIQNRVNEIKGGKK